MTTCPSWCDEPHDHRELMCGSSDHTHAVLHDLGSTFVAVHRHDDGDGSRLRVIVDPGADVCLTPAAAERFAAAVQEAVKLAQREGSQGQGARTKLGSGS